MIIEDGTSEWKDKEKILNFTNFEEQSWNEHGFQFSS